MVRPESWVFVRSEHCKQCVQTSQFTILWPLLAGLVCRNLFDGTAPAPLVVGTLYCHDVTHIVVSHSVFSALCIYYQSCFGARLALYWLCFMSLAATNCLFSETLFPLPHSAVIVWRFHCCHLSLHAAAFTCIARKLSCIRFSSLECMTMSFHLIWCYLIFCSSPFSCFVFHWLWHRRKWWRLRRSKTCPTVMK